MLSRRVAGHRRAGLADFAGMMGLVPPVTSRPFSSSNAKPRPAISDAVEEDMKRAAKELRGDTNE